MSSCSTAATSPPGSFSYCVPTALSLFPLALVPVAFQLPTAPAVHQQQRSRQRSDSRVLGDTTLILKNLPSTLTRDGLLRVLDDAGFYGCYDFLYLPTNMRNGGSYCYAFINMISHDAALDFFERLEGFCSWPGDQGRAMQVLWSDIQGQRAYIDKYRNSTVMHESVMDQCKPVVFSAGSRVPFPAPTQRVKAPRFRDRTPAEKALKLTQGNV